MSVFTTPLIVKHLDGQRWELVEPFEYYVGEEGSDEVICVHEGFITDFASIPRLFWSLIGHPTGLYGKSAVIHDWCYFKKLYTRKRCDEIFLEGMEVLGVGWLKRYTMFWAVRMWAWIGWNIHRRRNRD